MINLNLNDIDVVITALVGHYNSAESRLNNDDKFAELSDLEVYLLKEQLDASQRLISEFEQLIWRDDK